MYTVTCTKCGQVGTSDSLDKARAAESAHNHATHNDEVFTTITGPNGEVM